MSAWSNHIITFHPWILAKVCWICCGGILERHWHDSVKRLIFSLTMKVSYVSRPHSDLIHLPINSRDTSYHFISTDLSFQVFNQVIAFEIIPYGDIIFLLVLLEGEKGSLLCWFKSVLDFMCFINIQYLSLMLVEKSCPFKHTI